MILARAPLSFLDINFADPKFTTLICFPRDQRHVSINLLNKQEILRILRRKKAMGKKKLNTKFLASNS